MKESSKPYTAFVTSEGLFAFKRRSFGLVNSGASLCFCYVLICYVKAIVCIHNSALGRNGYII